MALQIVAIRSIYLAATLPTGYELAEEAPVIQLSQAYNYRIGVISRSSGCFEQPSRCYKTAQYFNASADKKEAYDRFASSKQPLDQHVIKSKSTKL